MWGSRGSNYEEYYLLRSDVVQTGRGLLTASIYRVQVQTQFACLTYVVTNILTSTYFWLKFLIFQAVLLFIIKFLKSKTIPVTGRVRQ
jgi:hypothetical protein